MPRDALRDSFERVTRNLPPPLKDVTEQRALSFGESLRDFGGSVDPVYYDLANEYEKVIAPALLMRDNPRAGGHDLLELIRKPPENPNDLGLEEVDLRIVEFSARLRNTDLSGALAKNAGYLIGLKPGTSEYARAARKFHVDVGGPKEGEIPAPMKPREAQRVEVERIDSHGRTKQSMD